MESQTLKRRKYYEYKAFLCFLKINHHRVWRHTFSMKAQKGFLAFWKDKAHFSFLYSFGKTGVKELHRQLLMVTYSKPTSSLQIFSWRWSQDGARRWKVGLCLALPRGATDVSLGKVEIRGWSTASPHIHSTLVPMVHIICHPVSTPHAEETKFQVILVPSPSQASAMLGMGDTDINHKWPCL